MGRCSVGSCDRCHSEGPPTIYFKDKDFDLCLWCISDLFWENIDQIKEYYQATSQREIKITEKTIMVRKVISEDLRNEIYTRDGHKCKKCNSTDYLAIDHIIPFIKGGRTERANLQTLCKSCNSRKNDRS